MCGIVRKVPGRHITGVIHTTDGNGPVRVTPQKIHNHFVAHSGQLNAPKAATCPRAGNTQPAGAVFIGLPVAIPQKLNLDATILIGPQLLAALAHHLGGLRAVGTRNRCTSQRAIRLAGRDHQKIDEVVAGHAALAGTAYIQKVVIDLRHQIVAVVLGARMIAYGQQITRRDTTRISLGLSLATYCLQGFQPQAGVMFTMLRLGVATRPFVDFQITQGMFSRVAARGVQAGSRLAIVVVSGRVATRSDLLIRVPGMDMLNIGMRYPVGGNKGQLREPGRSRMLTGIIGHHQGMGAITVLKPVVNPLAFHQAANKLKVAFLILNAIGLTRVVLRQARLPGKGVAAQHVLQNLGHGLFLKDPAVHVLAQEPEPGAQGGSIRVEAVAAAGFTHQAKCADTTIQKARHCKRCFDFQAQGLAQQAAQIQQGGIADHIHLQFKRL